MFVVEYFGCMEFNCFWVYFREILLFESTDFTIN